MLAFRNIESVTRSPIRQDGSFNGDRSIIKSCSTAVNKNIKTFEDEGVEFLKCDLHLFNVCPCDHQNPPFIKTLKCQCPSDDNFNLQSRNNNSIYQSNANFHSKRVPILNEPQLRLCSLSKYPASFLYIIAWSAKRTTKSSSGLYWPQTNMFILLFELYLNLLLPVSILLRAILNKENKSLSYYMRCFFIVHAFASYSQAYQLKPASLSSKQAVVGHDVHLPCEFPYLPDKPALILWFKNQNTRPFYSFDARKEGNQFKIHDSFDLGERTSFSYKNTDDYTTQHVLGYLIIKNITLDDAGNFTCRVDFQKAQTTTSLLQLEVHEPIWSLSVEDSHGREVTGETAPYEEGKRLYLTCRAYGGHPLPTVRWITDNEIISTSIPQTLEFIPPRRRWKNIKISSENLQVEAVLQIPSLRRENQGNVFTCQANNSDLTPIRMKSITLNMSLRPIHINIEGPSNYIRSGEEAQFSCRSWGSRPTAKLKWGPQSLLKMLNYQNSLDANVTISKAQLIPSPDDDGVSINCTAINPYVTSYTISTAIKLIVYYAPQVEVQLATYLSANKIKEGDDIFFVCNVRANPRPTSLAWLHEGKLLYEDKENGILVQGQNLVLQKVSRYSRGKYQCKATNEIATVTSETVFLKIMFVPECSEPQNITVLVSENEEVLLNCSVVSYPQPTEFIWRLNGSNGWQNIDSGKISSFGLSSSFSYSAKAKRHPVSMLNGINLRDTFIDDSVKGLHFHGHENIGSHYRTSFRTDRTHKSHRPIYAYNQDKHHPTAPSRLQFNPTESYGVVYCLAKNSVGKQKDACIFHISPAGPPGNLVACSFANQSATTLRVTCLAGHNGGLKQAFRAMALDQDTREIVANMTSPTPEFYLTGLIPGKDYWVVVTAFNSKGTSHPFVLEGFSLKVAENKIKDENDRTSNSVMKLFLGGIIGIILVIGILIFLTRIRYKRRHGNALGNHQTNDRSGEKDPLSPSSNPSMDDILNDEKESNERDACFQVPDITAQTPDSLGSISTMNSEKHSRRMLSSTFEEVGSQCSYGSASTPPPLLGLSNTYARISGLPKAGEISQHSNVKATTLAGHSRLNQSLPPVDLTKVTSNVNKYYTLKINCTRQNNESFV